jgi:hypothetical protein
MNIPKQVRAFQKFSLIGITIGILVTAGGCAKYKQASLTKPIGDTVEKNKVHACAQELSNTDCRRYFSRNIGKKGYQAVQLCIENKSTNTVVLDASTINLPIENKDHVASRLHIDATPRVVGWGVAGLFIWPFLIPAVVEAVQVPQANRMLDNDFDSRVLDMHSRVSIKPYASLNTVFFVRKENTSDVLQFSLKDVETKTSTNFSVNIA